ncbi:DUF222 domain-containing protein, partial [Mycobacterium sherrisii]
MRSTDREGIQADFDALCAAVSRIQAHSYEALTTPECFGLLELLEHQTRRLQAPGHQLINRIGHQATAQEMGGKLSHALAERLHISRAESARRVAQAGDLGPRQALTGEPVPPRLPATAAAQREGALGAGHVAVIRQFFTALPSWVDIETQALAEQQLA